MKDSYHIEYDLPFDHNGDAKEIVKTLAGHIEYIMDDIIHDLGFENYQLLFYYLTDVVILNRMQSIVDEKVQEVEQMLRSLSEEDNK